MNSKEMNKNEVNDVDEDSAENVNDNQVQEQSKNCKTKVQNGISSDQHKLNINNNNDSTNNNNSIGDDYCIKSSLVVSNGSSSRETDDDMNDEMICNQSRYKVYGSNNPNISATSNFPMLNSDVANIQQLSTNNCSSAGSSRINDGDDIDMINNVDYNSGINKCPPKVSCNSTNQSSFATDCSLNNIGGSIGSTSQGTCCFLRPNINGNRDVAGPSGLPKREQVERRDSSSGNEGDDFLDEEDYCIYTYKGNNETDDDDRLQNAGHLNNHEAAEQQHSGRSSPEMDFLEMDFDPGPSCEQDTGDSDLASINEDIQNIAMDNVESDPVYLNDLSGGKVVSRQQSSASMSPQPSHQKPNVSSEPVNQRIDLPSGSNSNQNAQSLPSTSCGIQRLGSLNLYRNAGFPSREPHGYHNTSGDLISPGDNRDNDAELWADVNAIPLPENSALQWLKVNLSSTLWHRMMAKKMMLHKQTAFNQSGESNLESELCNDRLNDFQPVERVMIWTEQEATMKQVTQISTSACGATSAVNALLALDVPFSLEVLVKGVATRLREPGTPLPRYLVSRSQAGATHRDLIRGLNLATNGAVISKFFSFYPERAISLSHWLHYWISRGAVPIATLNLQNCGKGYEIPDAWHHQMIFGVSQAGIYFTNPLECLPEQLVWHQLVSPSVLLIRRADVLAHWNSSTDLTSLMRMDHRWRRMNVLGQVVNMIRESFEPKPTIGTVCTSHIRIPASYHAGITLVMKSDAPAAEELLRAEQLPLL